MSRKKITEYKAKSIVFKTLGLPFDGIFVNGDEDLYDFENKSFVVKVDQGVKGRMKKGLVRVNVKSEEIPEIIGEFKKQGYNSFLIEEFVDHKPEEEKFLSVERVREGFQVYYSLKGGIHIESNKDDIQKILIHGLADAEAIQTISQALSLPQLFLRNLLTAFDRYFFSFLEINPLVIKNSNLYFLDLAVEVDSAAEFFTKKIWGPNDFVEPKGKTDEEKAIVYLSQKSPSAFTLDVLNADGSVFLLLSGGGASLVIADEVYNLGFGKELANYGEYSGNPNSDETYVYAKNILSILMKSHAKKKVLIIGGGVANFTDIRVTFQGIQRALSEVRHQLTEEKVQIFVRRGGPHQSEGLTGMKKFLKDNGLYGAVYGPEEPLTNIVKRALERIRP